MLRFLTAGESHGPSLTAILEGIPAGLAITPDIINRELEYNGVSVIIPGFNM